MVSSLIKQPYVIFLECTVAGLTLMNEEECLQSVRAFPAQHNAATVIVKTCVVDWQNLKSSAQQIQTKKKKKDRQEGLKWGFHI